MLNKSLHRIHCFSNTVMFFPALGACFCKTLKMSKKCLWVVWRVCCEKCLKKVWRQHQKKRLFVFTRIQGCFNVCVGSASHMRSVYNVVVANVNKFHRICRRQPPPPPPPTPDAAAVRRRRHRHLLAPPPAAARRHPPPPTR